MTLGVYRNPELRRLRRARYGKRKRVPDLLDYFSWAITIAFFGMLFWGLICGAMEGDGE